MFAYIKGKLEMKYSNYVVIETAGIGYKIFMSEPAMEAIGQVGDMVKVYTHYHVREDEISLYGFHTSEELQMFELLIGVSGIGAKSAINMLSNISPSSFALAVITNDTSKLVKIPGIGAKSAARIILELKDKLKDKKIEYSDEQSDRNVVKDDNRTVEAISALQVLGYNTKEIEKALEKFDQSNMSVEEIIKKALFVISSN